MADIETIRIKDLEEVSVNDLDKMWVAVDSATPDSTNKVKLSAMAAYIGGVADGKYIPLAGSAEITGSLLPKLTDLLLGSEEHPWQGLWANSVSALAKLIIPGTSPSDPDASRIYLWADADGNYSEIPGGGGVADIYDLTLRKNGTSLGTYNLGEQAADINIPIGWTDLTEDSFHKFVSQSEKDTWSAKQNAISDLTTIRGNANKGATAYSWGDHSLAGYATPSDISTAISALGLGTASQKDFVTTIVSGGAGLPTADAIYTFVNNAVTAAQPYKGVSSTAITDGGTEKPTISGYTTRTKGDVVAYNKKEFIWEGDKWRELGDEGSYALKTVQVIAGTGLAGGGAISQDVTLSLSSATIASLGLADTALQSSDMKALTLKVGSITVESNYNALTARTYTITKENLTDTIGSTTYAPYHADGYLPLSAGSTKPLTGDLYFDSSSANKHIYFKYANNGLGSALRMSRGGSLILGENQRTNGNSTSIYGSELIVDFGTDAAPYAVLFSGGIVRPFNSTVSLGSSASRWDEVYASKVYSDVVKVSDILAIPTSAPSSTASGEVYLWASSLGDYAETPSGGGTATIYDLTIRKNGTSLGTVNLGEQAGNINIPVGWFDLTPDASHRFLTDTQISTWNAKQNAISDLATIRSNASHGNTAYGWGDHSQAGYLTSIPKATTSTLGGIIVGTGLSIDSSGVLSFSADLSSYATIAYADAQDALLAEGIASNSNRLSTIEDWFREFDIEDLVPAWSLKPAKPAYTPKEIFGSSSIGDSTTPVYFNGTTLVAASLANKYVTIDTTQTITGSKALKAISLLNIPTSAPSSPESGKVYLWADTSGNYAETPGGGGTATVYNLYLKRGSVTIGPYNLGVQDQTADLASLFAGYALSTEIPTALSDLTDDSTHRLVTDTQITAWAAAATASHSHSNKSVLDGISSTNVTNWGTAYTRTDVQDNSYLMYDGGGHLMVDWQAMEQEVESYLSLGDASLKDYTASVTSGSGDLVTSGAVYSALQNYALASSVPTKVSDLTNDSGFISASYADGQDAVIAEGVASISARIASIEDWFRNPSLDEITADRFNGKLSFSNVVDAPDLTAIEALTGTSGLLKKTAANTWSLVAANLDNIADGSTRKLANYLPLAGGTMTGVINSMNILPKANNTYDLGSSSKKFKDIYSSGTVFADGALAIPTSAPSNPVSGKVYFWCDTSGSYAETPQAS